MGETLLKAPGLIGGILSLMEGRDARNLRTPNERHYGLFAAD